MATVTASQIDLLVSLGKLSQNEGERAKEELKVTEKESKSGGKWTRFNDYVVVTLDGFVKTKKTPLSFEDTLKPLIEAKTISLVRVYCKVIGRDDVRHNIQVIVPKVGSLTAENFKPGSAVELQVLKALKGFKAEIQLDPNGSFNKVTLGEGKGEPEPTAPELQPEADPFA